MTKYILLPLMLAFTILFSQAQDAEQKVKDKGIVLPAPSKPVANYVNAVRVGNLFFHA